MRNFKRQDWKFNKISTSDRTTLASELTSDNKYLIVFDTDLEIYYVWDGAVWIEKDWFATGGGGGAPVDNEMFTAENKDSVTIKMGQAVTTHSSGSGVVRASASATSTFCCGLANEDIAPASSGEIITDGILELSNWTDVISATNLAAKTKYFLNTTSAKLTSTSPTTTGQISQFIGVSVSPTKLKIEISNPVLL